MVALCVTEERPLYFTSSFYLQNRHCNPGVQAAFLNSESRDCRRPNPRISEEIYIALARFI